MKTLKTMKNKVMAKVMAAALCMGLIFGVTQPMTVHAAGNEFISAGPTQGTGYIDYSVKYLTYLDNGDLYAEFYVYNGLPYAVYGITNLNLQISNSQMLIANKTINLNGCLAPGAVATFSTVYNGANDHIVGAVLNEYISLRHQCNYRY